MYIIYSQAANVNLISTHPAQIYFLVLATGLLFSRHKN